MSRNSVDLSELAKAPVRVDRIEALFDGQPGKSGWDQLKREPKRPGAREIAGYVAISFR
ncbi:hypothetical protein [Cupriavidus sp. SK-4]|uniref:hypothetical protein n=1 Tax=Cupriavidus sp. SK-4 TaxID=574750 RepID=UPI00190F931B|nr:hypothetical protein [Cupriavidus sp. SK-4]